ncbi:MAG: CAP domain-containing protein [Oscillochloridaceae bacterium]|nr:CAP domain-containing protein [Chloroflexaceae bacterium]MDW8392317.1 CAP domain-containing protein [Oscillochloridaceae bacterium]
MQRFRQSIVVVTGWFLALLALLLLLPGGAVFGTEQPSSASFVHLPLVIRHPLRGSWLDYVNYHRATARLPPVTENPSWSYGNTLHARYTVKNDLVEHTEDPGNPWYTPEGLAAAQSSNLVAHSDINATDAWAIDRWMQGPFHAIGIIDPELLQSGYGSYREADGGLQMGAGLDVIRGLGRRPSSVTFPVQWPADGAIVPLTAHQGEYPDPLASCPGYSLPSGLPIILQLGPGDRTPAVAASAFLQGTTPLPHCVFDETSYVNADSAQQALGRVILDARDAVIVIPRSPLTPGMSYTVSVTANGQTHTWSFTVSSSATTVSE